MLVPLAFLTTGVGAMMIQLGIGRGLLLPRRVARTCPACGRLIDGTVCRACTGKTR